MFRGVRNLERGGASEIKRSDFKISIIVLDKSIKCPVVSIRLK